MAKTAIIDDLSGKLGSGLSGTGRLDWRDNRLSDQYLEYDTTLRADVVPAVPSSLVENLSFLAL